MHCRTRDYLAFAKAQGFLNGKRMQPCFGASPTLEILSMLALDISFLAVVKNLSTKTKMEKGCSHRMLHFRKVMYASLHTTAHFMHYCTWGSLDALHILQHRENHSMHAQLAGVEPISETWHDTATHMSEASHPRKDLHGVRHEIAHTA